MLLIGAGFVVATTVRTAIIFASVPRGLPATAAALNEVSVSMGARAALVLVTTFVAGAATSAYGRFARRPSARRGRCRPRPVPSLPARDRDARVPRRSSPGRAPQTWRPTGRPIRTRSGSALLSSGVGALVGSVIAGIALGPRDPLHTVWEHQDERPTAAERYDGCGTVVSRSRRQPKRSMIR